DLDLTTLNPLLGDLLVEAGVALRQEVSEAARESGGSGRRLGEELLVRGSVREVDLYRVLAEQHGVPFVRAADVLPRIDAALLRELPRRFLDFHMFLPIAREGGRIHVATPDVSLAVDEISSMFDDAPIAVELLSPTDLQRVWVAVELGLLDQRLGLPAARAADRAEERPSATPVTADGRLRELLSAAIEQGASAVHVEGGRASARVRLRVDGELVEVADCGIAAIEIAGLTAAARELDGRTCEVAGRRIAVSACACEHVATPALTLRVRDVDQEALLLDQIGHSDEFVAGVRGALQARRGLLLIGGPARSGRSTTLRAAHAELLQDVGRKVVWIDDAQGRTGEHDLIAALRAAGQQEADVVCLDAGADEELLRAALASARAGMLVLMTTDGNDAADVLQGLIGRGVDVRTLAADVVGVTVQHLARRICHGCRRPLDASEADIAATFPHGVPEGFFGFDGVGCEHCHGRGVRGLVPLAEFLPMGPAVRRALRRDVAPHDLGPIARQNGLVSLLDSALVRATAGEVRLAEIRRVLTEEQRELTGNYGPLPGICS
ncbi:MAG TPA: hypothetical protein ENI87_04250, partial [bacterium]|nr:hypothetical protein [bacterium]